MKYLKTYEEINSENTTKLSKYQFDKYLKGCTHLNLKDKPIYRSIDLDAKYYYINPSIPYNKYYLHNDVKLRRSAYTNHNYYTLLINHLESYSEFPKRQIICSAKKYYMNDNIYRVLPLEDIKIGVVPAHDIQDSWKCEFKDEYNMSPYDLNDFYVWNKISDDDWESFAEDISKIKEGVSIRYYGGERNKYYGDTNIIDNYYYTLLKLFDLEQLNEVFSPKNLNFNSLNYSKYIKTELENNELWIDKPHLLIKI